MREGRVKTQALTLALVDGLMVLLAMQVAWWLRFDLNAWLASVGYWHPFTVGWTPGQPYILAIFVTLPMFWLILREMGLYAEPESDESEFFRLCAAALVASVLLAAVGFFIKLGYQQNQFQYSRAYSLIFLPFSVVLLALGRKIYRVLLRIIARHGIGQNRILFVGNGPLAEELAHALDRRGTNIIVGTLEAAGTQAAKPSARQSSDALPGSIFKLERLGQAADLVSLCQQHQIDEVIVALPDAPQDLLRTLAEDCYRAHVRFRLVPDVYEMLLDHMHLSLVGDIPLLGMRGSRIEGVNFLCKRLFDIVVSSLLLVILIPLVFLPTALAIRLGSPGPIFYYQERIGYRRRKFRFWKFRSMRVGSDQGGDVSIHKEYLKKYIAGTAGGAKDEKGRTIYKITEDPRVTPIGRFIRQYSIDELPQLWNVLKGDMSLIGPRPPIAYEVENYRPIHYRRFEVLPGISGLWQVSGRNRLTFDEMVKLDLYYIENWSLELDLRILFKTISVVLFQRAH
ncbi:MAG TPA: sugar transferase [Planctomycetota bacterium]|nr:sugar transferase [Planctomycetota bacterium]